MRRLQSPPQGGHYLMGGSHLSIKKNLLACRESDSRPGARPRNVMSWTHTEECCFFGKTSLRRVALIFS